MMVFSGSCVAQHAYLRNHLALFMRGTLRNRHHLTSVILQYLKVVVYPPPPMLPIVNVDHCSLTEVAQRLLRLSMQGLLVNLEL
jgi:hypothetical protein